MDYQISKKPDALLNCLKEHELVISELYHVFSRRFLDHTAFWKKLSQDEQKHAACLDNLRLQVRENPDIVIIERFSTDAIEFSIQYVKKLIDRADHPDFTLIEALSLAVKLEEALLEFAGCAIVISHDLWFLDRIASHMLAFEGESQVVWFEGNYADYEADKKRRLGDDSDQPHRIKYKKLEH